MISKKQELFGGGEIKPYLIHRLVDDRIEEGGNLDYKTYIGKSPNEEKAAIVRAVVGFFNKWFETKSSLLIIGVEAKEKVPNGIKPVLREAFDSTRLRQLITDKVGSLPPYAGLPKFEIYEVDMDKQGLVFVVEAYPRPDAVCYSKYDNQVYVRRGDETRPLQLSEVFGMVERVTKPKLALMLEKSKVWERPPQRPGWNLEAELAPKLVNEGSKPAREVTIVLRSFRGVVLSSNDPSYIYIYEAKMGFTGGFVHLISKPLYPFPLIYPTIVLPLRSIDLLVNGAGRITADIYEEETLTHQEFEVDERCSIKEDEEKRIQGPYGYI